jgi:(R)-2-hydroxyacyl-CoA dehydratese activating ATPase
VSPTGAKFHENSLNAFSSLLKKKEIKMEDVAYITSTGYGRKLLKSAHESVSEITANAVGAGKVMGKKEKVKTIINIGGQDLKVIGLDEEGNCDNFAMNDKCAAGTGRFLEMVARILETDVKALGDLHFKARGKSAAINNTCTVFAESEIIGLLANGHSLAEIVVGVHQSIAKRITRLANKIGLRDPVFFDGGPAMNRGLVEAVENELLRDVTVPKVPHITTSIGAALIAKNAFMGELIHA